MSKSNEALIIPIGFDICYLETSGPCAISNETTDKI